MLIETYVRLTLFQNLLVVSEIALNNDVQLMIPIMSQKGLGADVDHDGAWTISTWIVLFMQYYFTFIVKNLKFMSWFFKKMCVITLQVRIATTSW